MKVVGAVAVGMVLGAAVAGTVAMTTMPEAERKVKHLKKNVNRAAHVFGNAVDTVGHMNWF